MLIARSMYRYCLSYVKSLSHSVVYMILMLVFNYDLSNNAMITHAQLRFSILDKVLRTLKSSEHNFDKECPTNYMVRRKRKK